MKYINDESLFFEQGTQINITRDLNFLLQDIPNSLRTLIDNHTQKPKDPEYLEQIKTAIKEYPKIGFLYKLLVDEYNDDDELHAKYTISYYEKFPDDFFAKLNMARVFLTQENYNGITSIYGKNISVLYAFPDREQFHYTEIADFIYFIIRYKISVGDIKGALENEKKLAAITSDKGFLEHVNEMIEFYKNELLELNKITVLLSYNFNDVYPELGITPEEIEILDDLRDRLYDIESPSPNFVVELQILVDKYPKNPYFKLFIADYYTKLSNHEAFIENINILLKAHPDFLMAKLEMAQLLLTIEAKDRSELELVNDAVRLLDDNLEFQHIKPYRKLYHIEDALMFYFVVLQIHLKYNKLDLAHNCLNIIKHIEEGSREHFLGRKLIDDYNRGVVFNNYN
ncbi:hypothetical protein A8C32_06430 [Flavivirga aquatica]|uniref:Tetratricopeptide repeat protein n=1 Tax=Flavivirga aquatica TaxID=1849968 RepID=A0A1E5SI66_9FLAO|nr:hypothetical protein [Flavivirga aquatica]OEJ98819.1 hypothetical protein A8C32_06430 [Flavivirga aquatica]